MKDKEKHDGSTCPDLRSFSYEEDKGDRERDVAVSTSFCSREEDKYGFAGCWSRSSCEGEEEHMSSEKEKENGKRGRREWGRLVGVCREVGWAKFKRKKWVEISIKTYPRNRENIG
ncbi:hypothetical protein KY289_024134 [Solanum tuberosum]|nr:hypothetical protein KY289_024134 [Solanum tuberosum]